MPTSLVISSDLSQAGEWIDLISLEALSATQEQELIMLCCSDLTMRRLAGNLQVFCQHGRDIAEITISVAQILADIALRERVVDRSVVQMNDLVEGVLCRMLKN